MAADNVIAQVYYYASTFYANMSYCKCPKVVAMLSWSWSGILGMGSVLFVCVTVGKNNKK